MTNVTVSSAPSRFASLTALHAAHAELLKRRHESESDPAFLDEIEVFIDRARATGALLDGERDRWAAQSIVDYWITVLDRGGRRMADVTLTEFDESLAPELNDDLCPYLGLDAFQIRDSDKFFGREALVTRMLDTVRQHRLLAVVGPSGSGKSSLVSAGLLPRLRAGALEGRREWRFLGPIVPGVDPLESLAQLARMAGARVQESRNDQQYLARVLSEGEDGSTPAVVVVDQFEELFTLCQDEEARAQFTDNLLELAQVSEPRHIVVITLRSDFESYLARLPAFQREFERGAIRLTPLTAGELREAIEKPASQIGLKFEDGLVDLLLHDILGEPAALPLLQFTLLKLWENRQRNRVTVDVYQRLGGGRLALARSADELWDHLIPEEQVTAKRILLRLVRPGEGLEVTSRRLPRAELHRGSEAEERIDRVLSRFVQARLLRLTPGTSPADDRFEVAHEALIRNWPKLVDWLEEERGRLRRRIQLTTAAKRWDTRGRERALLWRGSLLDDAAKEEELDELEKAFVTAGLAQRRRWRRRVVIVGASLVVSLLVIVAGIIYGLHRRIVIEAERNTTLNLLMGLQARADSVGKALAAANQAAAAEKQVATAREAGQATSYAAAAAAQNISAQDPERSLLLALYGVGRGRTRQAGDALRQALQGSWLQLTLEKEAGQLRAVAFSPNGTMLATVGNDHALVLYDAFSGKQTRRIPIVGSVLDVSFSPDGKTLVAGLGDGTVQRWTVDSSLALQSLNGHRGAVTRIAFKPDGRQLATASEDSTIRIWDLDKPSARSRVLPRTRSSMTSVAFSPDGLQVIAGGADGRVRLWDLAGGQARTFPSFGNLSAVLDVAFSPDGRRIAAATADEAVVWDTASAAEPVYRLSHRGSVRRIVFAPDGMLLATAGDDRRVHVWRATDGEALFTLPGHNAPVYGLSFSPAGDRIASASDDSTARIWDLSFAAERPYFGHVGAIWSVAFDSSDARLATASGDSTVKIWSLASGELLLTLDGTAHQGGARSVAFSRDGRRLVTTDNAGSLKLWNAITGALLGGLDPREQPSVWEVAFSPDGRFIATAGRDSAVEVWDAATLKQQARSLCCHDAPGIWSIAFRPDGRRVATAGADSVVRIWEWPSGRQLPPLSGHSSGALKVSYSRDGRFLATADSSGLVRIWDAKTGAALRSQIQAHNDQILGLAFSRDGILATASYDGTVKLWDSTMKSPLQTLSYGTTPILSLAFSHDGRHIATGSMDGALRLHVVDLDDLIALGHERITRVLAPEECDEYLPTHSCPRNSAEEMLIAGRRSYSRGDLNGAIAQFREAKKRNPQLQLDPVTEPQRLEARSLVAQGRSFARLGDAARASQRFREATRRDRTLRILPDTEARQLAIAFLLADGRRLAEAGLVDRATQQFSRARDLDPAAGIDPDTARALAVAVLVRDGIGAARDSRVWDAITKFRRASAIDSTRITGDDWNLLCWYGTLAGSASWVLPACDRAIARQDLGYIRDSRALARALTNNIDGAIEDYAIYVQDPNTSWRHAEQRRSWLDSLRLRHNPFEQVGFKDSVLALLRVEEGSPNLAVPYYDDFESAFSLARSRTLHTLHCDYNPSDGAFLIGVRIEDYSCDWRIVAGEVRPHARIEVVAHAKSGRSGTSYGIRFGDDPTRRSYFISEVSTDGRARIKTYEDSLWTDLAVSRQSAVVHTGPGGLDTLAVEVRDSVITFFVNGVLMQSYDAGKLVGGYVGMHAEGTDALVSFDDFRVIPLAKKAKQLPP